MKKVILGAIERDSKLHFKKLSEAQGYLNKALDCLDVARDNAYNGDSSGKLLSVVRQVESANKALSQYRSRDIVNKW